MLYDTYIFDLDGTLIDTLGDLTASCNYALRSCGMKEHPIDDIRRFVGNGVRKLMERAVPEGTDNPLFNQAFETFRAHYLEHGLDTTKPYPGIEETLKRLQQKGCRMAVVSNKFYDATLQMVRHFFGNCIEVAVGECEAGLPKNIPEGFPKHPLKKKPAPDTVNEALRQLNATTHNAVYVGDSDVDIMTARNSGLPCISVLWGFRDRDFLLAHGAKTLISQPEELLG